MQILHFGQEVFILLRNEVALREVTRKSGWTVIPHLRCRWWRETRSIHTFTHWHLGYFKKCCCLLRASSTGLITHSVIIKSLIICFFWERDRTYTARRKRPTLQLHSAGTATCDHTPWLHIVAAKHKLCTGGGWLCLCVTNRPSLMSLLIWRKYRCLQRTRQELYQLTPSFPPIIPARRTFWVTQLLQINI